MGEMSRVGGRLRAHVEKSAERGARYRAPGSVDGGGRVGDGADTRAGDRGNGAAAQASGASTQASPRGRHVPRSPPTSVLVPLPTESRKSGQSAGPNGRGLWMTQAEPHPVGCPPVAGDCHAQQTAGVAAQVPSQVD